MDNVDRAVVSPGFMFSLWDWARRHSTTTNIDAQAEAPPVKLMLVQGGLSEQVPACTELPMAA